MSKRIETTESHQSETTLKSLVSYVLYLVSSSTVLEKSADILASLNRYFRRI